ncbi:Alpha/Beta hydrolase protein [Jimgerdemannia flammicorona]|uniref:Alpha/Beta hydrolase protein n=1 Tax=Jimgerdemannia flammicorona TaxID=994334 RepID=A0A433QHZ7_9FUNG|nr:Alpha/Beta hydrolase protein [Jimgerdemannia flammicorona]
MPTTDFSLASLLTLRRILVALAAILFATPQGRWLAYRYTSLLNWVIAANLPRSSLFNTLYFAQNLPGPLLRFTIEILAYPRPKHDPWYKPVRGNDWKGVWIAEGVGKVQDVGAWTQGVRQETDVVIFYAHGGGYTSGHAAMFMDSWILWIEELKKHGLNAKILSLEYGLAPMNKYPSQLQESLRAYKYLIEDLKIDPSKIILGGDSAGANLMSATLLALHRRRFDTALPMPRGALLAHPWMTLDLSSSSHTRNQSLDYIHLGSLVKNRLNWLPADQQSLEYLRSDPYVAPVYAPKDTFVEFPHMFVAIGQWEVFYDDQVEFVSRLRADGVDVVVKEAEEMPHLWLLIPEVVGGDLKVWKEGWAKVAEWTAQVVRGERDEDGEEAGDGLEGSRSWEKIGMSGSILHARLG